MSQNTIISYKPIIEKTGDHAFRYKIDFDKLILNDKVGCVIISRPSNPSGNILDDSQIKILIERCKIANIPVIIDSAYSKPFPNLAYKPITTFYDDNVVLTFSLSKCGLPGERIGITIANPDIIEELLNFQTNFMMHSSRFGQLLAYKALEKGFIEEISEKIIKPTYFKRLHNFIELMNKSLDNGIPWYVHEVDGGMFVWLWLEGLGISDRKLYEMLKSQGVIVTPGSDFFYDHRENWRHSQECIRISISGVEREIIEGTEIIAKTINNLYKVYV